jgi:hypothetical protein
MTPRVSPARKRDWPTGLSAQPGAALRDGMALRSSLPRRPPPRRVFGRTAILCVVLCLPVVAGCQYIETARGMSDLAVTTSQFYKLESLVQLDIERRRVRSARCYSPLLTPATISAAAVDSRLGYGWVDELLRDCPQFAAFVWELTRRRSLNGGSPQPRDTTEGDQDPAAASIRSVPSPAVDDTAAEELGG